MDDVERVLRAVHTASSTTRLQVHPRRTAPICASPEETIRLIRAFTRIEDASLRMFLCDVLETLAFADEATRPR